MMKSCAAASRAACSICFCDAPGRPSAILAATLSSNRMASWLTTPMAAGPGESWLKPTVDLVQGEAMTPLQRLFSVADDANGLGTKLDIRKWTFMNTDLVVHVHRVPEGDWIGIRAETSYGPDGIGTTFGTLFDQSGPVGGIQQSVLVRPMPTR